MDEATAKVLRSCVLAAAAHPNSIGVNIRDHRDNLIRAFTRALDQCILAQEERPGSEVLSFVTRLNFDVTGPSGGEYQIVSPISMDLNKPYDVLFSVTAYPVPPEPDPNDQDG